MDRTARDTGDVVGGDGSRDGIMISLRHVTKRFDGTSGAAVDDLTLEVPEGETVVLVGPSGCGKTTTMRMINRLIEPTSGTIAVDGRDVRAGPGASSAAASATSSRASGCSPTARSPRTSRTVPELVGWDKARIATRVDELVDLVGLDRELARPVPGRAVRRPAAAGRRRPGARGGPAGAC